MDKDKKITTGRITFDSLYELPIDPSQVTLACVNHLASKIDSLDKRVTELICRVDSIMGTIERNGCDHEVL